MDIKAMEYQALLFDFYGELLTDKQKEYYEDHVCNDLTVSEIAQERGVSRQAAHDLIKRTGKILEEYEQKLHLVDRFLKIKQQVLEIDELAQKEKLNKISELTGMILEEL